MKPIALLLAASLALPSFALAEDVTVFAAASMKDALDKVAADWQAETGNTAIISYAGSSKLAQQIEEGAPAQLFISASTDWMDKLDTAGLLLEGSRTDLLGNSLVLVAHDAVEAPIALGSDFDLKGKLGENYLAMALVDSVPAGVYGKQSLKALGLWDSVSGQIAQADDVRAALTLVATGEAPFGIVYGTDAAADTNVSLFGTFDPASHDPITYPLAQIKETANETSAAFETYLKSEAAKAVFTSYGFTVLQ